MTSSITSSFPASYSTIVVLALLSLTPIYLLYRWLLPKPIPGIPYNPNAVRSLFGDIPAATSYISKTDRIWPWVAQQAENIQSPIFQIFMTPFGRPWVVLCDFRESQDVLLRRTKEFDRSRVVGDLFVGLVPDHHIHRYSSSEQFKSNRALMKDLMTPSFLNEVSAPRLYVSIQSLVNLWDVKARLAQGRAFPAHDDIVNATLDMISGAAFGLKETDGSTHAQLEHLSQIGKIDVPESIDAPVILPVVDRPPEMQAFITLVETIEVAVKAPFARLAHWVVRQMPFYRRANAHKEALLARELEKARQRFQSGDEVKRSALDDILHRELNAAKKEGRKPNYDSRPIKDELFGFIVGGNDTSSQTLAWGMKYIPTSPTAQNTLRAHLNRAYPAASREKRNPTVEEITKTPIPYLDATIEEIVRISRVFNDASREAMVDTTLLGHHIPKGTNVIMLGCGPDYFSKGFPIDDSLRSKSALGAKNQFGSWDPTDTEIFKPERWLTKEHDGNEVYNAMAGPLLSFGLGPRGCYGKRLAYLTMRIFVVLVIWNFELLPVPEEVNSFAGIDKLTTSPKQCYIRLRKVKI